MFFAGLFAAYFSLRATVPGPWPPRGVHLETAVAGAFTVVLVASSGTMHRAVKGLQAGDVRQYRRWLVATVVLAALFLGNQAHEFATVGFGIGSHAFGSAFFFMTGFHALHVTGGAVAMLFMLLRSAVGPFDAREAPGAEVLAYYWHFVDVVWVLLYATLFLLR
jgi:cytochrome c oxidase subunit III